jgi:hypothetical protein
MVYTRIHNKKHQNKLDKSRTYTRNFKCSWPQTGRHSHTNYIPGGVRNHRNPWMVGKNLFVVEIKLINPSGFAQGCRKHPDFFVLISKNNEFWRF